MKKRSILLYFIYAVLILLVNAILPFTFLLQFENGQVLYRNAETALALLAGIICALFLLLIKVIKDFQKYKMECDLSFTTVYRVLF